MRIAVIGAGSVGGTLAKALAAKGHAIVIGARDPSDPDKRRLAEAIDAELATVPEAAASAEAALLAVPWPQAENAVRSMGDLAGKILIDCTNPLRPDLSGLSVDGGTSAAETVAGWARGASVFKTFNHVGFDVMADPSFGSSRAVMFVCGDDAARKPAVMGLVRDVGFDAQDAGPLASARLLEQFALLWIHLAVRQNWGRHFAFALLRE